MRELRSQTQEPLLSESGFSSNVVSDDLPTPRLRLLYGGELSRTGSVTTPEALMPQATFRCVGRHEPAFVLPLTQGDLLRPLQDACISRSHFRVRWLPDEQVFQVSPDPSARQPLYQVTTSGRVAIEAPVTLPDGSCVAIGDRALLGLECARWRGPHVDRLGMVGESPTLWRLREDLLDIAQFEEPLLITGATGSGKELVARALHAHSSRSARPLVIVNCATLPGELVESQLFGHRKGAFTGATQNQDGLFQAADTGTLVLDEFGELPLGIQAKLLRVLQDGSVVPVGDHRTVHVDVRLVVATNRDLAAEVRAGRIREDLYHRIAAHILEVPALAERRLDIPELFVRFLDEMRQKHEEISWLWAAPDRHPLPIPLEFMIELMSDVWSGNVRELRNFSWQVARLNRNVRRFAAPRRIAIRDPAPESPPPSAANPTPQSTLAPDEALGRLGEVLTIHPRTLRLLLGEEDRARIQDVESWTDARVEEARALLAQRFLERLASVQYNQSRLARQLEIARNTITRLMIILQISRPSELEQDAIEAALVAEHHDVDRAAARLGVSPQGLKARLPRP